MIDAVSSERRVGSVEPVSLVLGALIAGAAQGAGEAVVGAVRDAHVGLREALKRRFSGNALAQSAVEEFISDPTCWGPALEAYLRQADVAADQALLDAAAAVMAAVDPVGASGGKYTVNLVGAQGVQVGDHARQTNYFGPAAQ